MKAFTIRKSDLDHCPKRSLSPRHYADAIGTCRCACLVHRDGYRLLDAPGRCDRYDYVRLCDFQIDEAREDGLRELRVARGPWDRELEESP